MRRLFFESLENRLPLAGVEFVGPLPQGIFTMEEIGCITDQNVQITAVAAGKTTEGGLAVRFRLHTGGPEPVKLVLQVNGDKGETGPIDSSISYIESSSMVPNGNHLAIVDGDTDFLVTGKPEARFLIFSVMLQDEFWLDNALSVAQRASDGAFISLDLQSAIADIAAGNEQIGVTDLSVPDINGDGFTSPLDALRVINYLNSGKSPPEGAGISFLEPEDVNGDGRVTPLDALLVINALHDAAFADFS